MAEYFVKLSRGEKSWILRWSSIVDAPTHVFDDEAELTEWYREEYGREGLRNLPNRLERLHQKGTTSHMDANAEATVMCNRAGKDETCMTVDQIIDYYCETDCEAEPPVGTCPHDDEEDV